jgi:hypothetical protein
MSVIRRPVRRAMYALAVTLAGACYLPARRAQSLAERGFYSFRFASERNVTVIAHAFALDTARTALPDVTGLGGRVAGYLGDTLLVEPYYVSRYDAGRASHQRTFGRGSAYRLPDIVLIVPGDDVEISDYALPVSARSRLVTQALLVVPNLILVFGMTYHILRRHW